MAISSLFLILAILLLLLALGVPIAYSIGIAALTAILPTMSLDVSVVTAAQRTFVGMSSFSLTAIPFFILAGNLMNQGGIARRLVDFVMALLGKLPGALLVTNAGANALFGAISGSASAAAAAVGSMVQRGLCPLRPFDSPLQRPDYLLSGLRRHLRGGAVFGRLRAGAFVDRLLHLRRGAPGEAQGLPGYPRQV